MKKLLSVFIAVASITAMHTYAQQVNFKTLEFSYFDYDFTTPNGYYLGAYIKIDSSGNLVARTEGLIKKEMSFFSYKLNEKEILLLNSFFQPKKKLSTCFVTKKLGKGEMYAAFYDFFSIRYKDKTADSVCTISSFMGKKYNEIMDMFTDILYEESDRKKSISPFAIDKLFVNSLITNYRKATFLPKKVHHPPFKVG